MNDATMNKIIDTSNKVSETAADVAVLIEAIAVEGACAFKDRFTQQRAMLKARRAIVAE